MITDLPRRLQAMLLDGTWGTSGTDLDARVTVDVARRWDPDCRGIHLVAPPTTLEQDLCQVPGLAELWNLADIDPAQCVVIADFGLGSDNPIVLDMTREPPPVLMQRWESDGSSRRATWHQIADTFDEFVAILGL